MYLNQFFVEGLGCASYIIGCEAEGVAAIVDPDRDVQKYLDAAAARNLKITHIIETHLHADHVSGNTNLAAHTGAAIYLHEASGAEFDHQQLKAGDHLMLGNIRLDVLHTPGHTPESITLLVSDTTRAEKPWLAMTGDTLFVGDVGRPDLVGIEAARGLAGQMHSSLFDQILKQDDSLLICPGHGAGSLCGRSIGSMRSTTLGYERMANPSLAPREKQEFIEYSYSNPINYTDPSGFDPYWCDDYKNDPQKKQACIGWYLKNKGYQVNPEQRRAMAAQLARDWAAVDWPTWCKTGFWSPTCANEDPAELKKWLESQDPPMNCFDCTRFVSWVLWSVGFPMDWTGGWWAQHVPEFTGKEEARAWSNADAFYLWWTSSDRGVMAAKVVAEENFMTLLPGDIIMYGRKIDSTSPEYPIYNGDTFVLRLESWTDLSLQ